MPFCDSQTLLILLIVVVLFAVSPDPISEKAYGRRRVDDVFLLALLAFGIAALVDNCPRP